MRFGVREICDVAFRAKSKMTLGGRTFYKNEPVIYFDSLKTSSLEGASTTVYATGGRGNTRLIAWEGERTVTFTMEDALLSPMGFAVLSGAGIVKASATDKIKVLESGADDFISEPVNSEEFKIRIKAHIRREYETNLDVKTNLPTKKSH